jgi:hypothetical protein
VHDLQISHFIWPSSKKCECVFPKTNLLMRPLSAQLCPARHRIGPTSWSLLQPSQRNHRLSFMKVQALHELCSEITTLNLSSEFIFMVIYCTRIVQFLNLHPPVSIFVFKVTELKVKIEYLYASKKKC